MFVVDLRTVRLNRMARVLQYVPAYMRYQLGLRSRPTRPPGVSDKTIFAARELVRALLEERP